MLKVKCYIKFGIILISFFCHFQSHANETYSQKSEIQRLSATITTCNTQGHCAAQEILPPAIVRKSAPQKDLTHTEKTQLSPHYTLPALSGVVVDAETGQPIQEAIVSFSWILQWEKGELPVLLQKFLPRLMVKQLVTNQQGFFHSDRHIVETNAMTLANWKLPKGTIPLIRIYAKGYQRLEIKNFQEPLEGENSEWKISPLYLSKLPNNQATLLEELMEWRNDIDIEMTSYNLDVKDFLEFSRIEKLVRLFTRVCDTSLSSIDKPINPNVCRSVPERNFLISTKVLLEYINVEQHPAILSAAAMLGKKRYIPILKQFIEQRNIPLFTSYIQAYKLSFNEPYGNRNEIIPSQVLGFETEELLVNYYTDQDISPLLIELLHTHYYQDKRIFDLIYQELESNNISSERQKVLLKVITNTYLPDIEPQLLKLFPSLPPQQQASLIIALDQKYQYPLMITEIETLLLSNSLNKDEIEEITTVILPRIGTQQAADLAVSFLEKNLNNLQFLSSPNLPRFLTSLSNFHRDIKINWSIVKQVFTEPMTEPMLYSYLNFIRERRPKEEAEKIPQYITKNNMLLNQNVIYALAAFDDQQLCQQVLLILQQNIKDGIEEKYKNEYTNFISTMNQCGAKKIPLPNLPKMVFVDHKKSWALREKLKRLTKAFKPLYPNNTLSNPQRLVMQQQAFIKELKKLSEHHQDLLMNDGLLRRELELEIIGNIDLLGDILRYKLKKPLEAVQEYESLAPYTLIPFCYDDLLEFTTYLLNFLRLADVYRYDLNDNAKAIEYYILAKSQISYVIQILINLPRSAKRGLNSFAKWKEAAIPIFQWLELWLTAEIDFLSTGKPFEGDLPEEVLSGFKLGIPFLMFSQTSAIPLPSTFFQIVGGELTDINIFKLPFSSFTFISSLGLITSLEDNQLILKYLIERDSARFITASFLAIVDGVDVNKLSDRRGLYYSISSSIKQAEKLKSVAQLFFEQNPAIKTTSLKKKDNPEKMMERK
jgi:hypothetical protein